MKSLFAIPTYIEYREANGGFKTVEELGKVKGIGKATLEKLRLLVAIE